MNPITQAHWNDAARASPIWANFAEIANTAFLLANPEPHAEREARLREAVNKAVAPTCQVQLIGGEVQTMTRESAKWLQAETRDTHDWFTPEGTDRVTPLEFIRAGIYTYRPKAKKVIPWSSLPVGVMTNKGELRYVNPVNNMACCEHGATGSHNWEFVEKLTLSPAADQPWLNWRGGECPVPAGIVFEVTLRNGGKFTSKTHSSEWAHVSVFDGSVRSHLLDIIEYRIVGIESGYEMGGN